METSQTVSDVLEQSVQQEQDLVSDSLILLQGDPLFPAYRKRHQRGAGHCIRL